LISDVQLKVVHSHSFPYLLTLNHSLVTYQMDRSIISLLLLSLSINAEVSNETYWTKVYKCHASQVAELGGMWRNVIADSGSPDKNCTNNNCMMMWGLTKDRRVRILAQGCSMGSMHTPIQGKGRMQNECPSGTGVGVGTKPILRGTDGFHILSSLTHIQICLCQSDWCNFAPLEDGDSCEDDRTPFCNPRDSDYSPSKAQSYAIPDTDDTENGTMDGAWAEAQGTFTGSLPGFIRGSSNISGAIIGSSVLDEIKGWIPIVVLASLCGTLIGILFYALLQKFNCNCAKKPAPDSVELLGVKVSKRRHTSGRLNSIAQVTILTEVAQGYKQEAEELIRECQAGGPHQIANWKYDDNVKLGTGSFGDVYKVVMKPEFLLECKSAALKTFSHMRSTHFFNETRTLKYVHAFKNHPNIIQYLGRAVDCRDTLEEATWRIALELCDGGSVRDWITSTRITLTQYLEAASGLLSALSFLHNEECAQTSLLSNFRLNSTDSGNPDSRSTSRSRRSSKGVATFKRKLRIAHCDINSRNVLVRNPITGKVALADFGLALTDREKRQEEVQIREIGTIRYLAPEMLQNLINLNDTLNSLILVDTYATGLVLWEMLTRTVEMYDDDSEVPVYAPPYEKELGELGEATANRFEAMNIVVVRRCLRPLWSNQSIEWREREEEAATRDEESDLNEEEKFLLLSVQGIDSMLARDPDARMTIPAMAEKVDRYRLQRLQQARRRVSRDDSVLDETSASN
ncbi:hypothetical protein PFISCL1PPCAC_16399, partial [Pristionchus fissidentatus]